MISHAELDTNLAGVEAALGREISGSVDISASLTKINLELAYVRVCCRQLRAALVGLDETASAGSIGNARAYCRELRIAVLELIPSATIPFHCDQSSCKLLSPMRTTCWLAHLQDLIAVPRRLETSAKNPASAAICPPAQAVQRSGADATASKAVSKTFPAPASLLRQAVDLLVLVLAYLSYYFIDVRLEILNLPLIFTLPIE